MKKCTEVTIYGERYSVRSELPDELMAEIAAYVDTKMRKIKGDAPIVSTSTVAIMAALNIAEELFLLKSQREELSGLLEQKSTQLIDVLDKCLA